ncbi:acid protease [Exidia glandulosa HHB12029]|uniref:Acid protease n=1 Tax=Exidia glandulosa HHB12029 TaxID=1314781 RepID=A0A166A539_EXIGL|nr:acid protease [Exidia glandulosa HHB12029]
MPNLTLVDAPSDIGSLTGGKHGSQALTDYGGDSFYYGPVNIGSPGQVLNVDVDTGSADLWVQSNCPKSKCTSPQFNQTKSKTFKNTKQSFNIQYGSGSASGQLAQDTVTVASLTAKNQYFGVVNDPSEDFEGTPSSGLLGLAFSSIASSGKPTFFETVLAQYPTNSISPLFSVFLTRRQSSGSQVCFGCYDTSKVRKGSGITWLPVTSKTYWTVAMTGAVVNGRTIPATNTIFAAIDTGTTLIYVPAPLAKSIYARIPGAQALSNGYYRVPCSNLSNSLTVSLMLNGSPFSIDMRDFNLGRVSASSSYCVAGILALGDNFPSNLAIVGDEFLKSWYSTYDYSNGARVGLSRSIN